MTAYMARQGDVLLVEVDDELPRGCVIADFGGGDVILARGEATGHAHRMASHAAALYRAPDGACYLRADESTALVHEEHDPIPVPPGTYRVIRQREYPKGTCSPGSSLAYARPVELDHVPWREIED
jgi:hypothetical protein